jgi:hypothetical protein
MNDTPTKAIREPIASGFVSFSLQKSIAKNIVNNGDVQRIKLISFTLPT